MGYDQLEIYSLLSGGALAEEKARRPVQVDLDDPQLTLHTPGGGLVSVGTGLLARTVQPHSLENAYRVSNYAQTAINAVGNSSSGKARGDLRLAPYPMREANYGQDRLASVLLALASGRAGAGPTGKTIYIILSVPEFRRSRRLDSGST